MVQRLLLVSLSCVVLLVGMQISAGATASIPLALSQGEAFAILGHSCGGIQEKSFATGFDPASGYPTGDVYTSTRCGGSGRGGGYHTTTYSAWVAVTWDFTGAVVSYAKLASAPVVDPNLSTFDANGNEVTNASNSAYLVVADGYVPAPRVTGISVATGPAAGGTTVTITGDGFTNATAVQFGADSAAFVINSDTSITATSPSASAGTFDITVSSSGGTSATFVGDQFTFVAAPVVTSVDPNTGPVTGGTAVTITGTGFSDASLVRFGGDPAGFAINSDTSITAISPAIDTPDTADVTVTSIGGQSKTSSADRFNYVAAQSLTCTTACVSVGDASVLEGDIGTRVLKFPITLSQTATTPVSVDYSVSDISATGGTTASPGVDYKETTGTTTFAAGTSEKFVSVTVYSDATPESDEAFAIALGNVSGAILGRDVGFGTIVNDDGVTSGVTCGVGDASEVASNTRKTSLAIPITLSANAAAAVTVSYRVDPGSATYSATATGGGDFGGKANGTLTFAAGSRLKWITVPVWPNANPTGDKSLTITITNVSDPSVTTIRDTGTATILAAQTG